MPKWIDAMLFWFWWQFAGYRRTQESFKFLSDEIIENRKRISRLKSQVLELERKVWFLEDHTPEENLRMATEKLGEFAEAMRRDHHADAE